VKRQLERQKGLELGLPELEDQTADLKVWAPRGPTNPCFYPKQMLSRQRSSSLAMHLRAPIPSAREHQIGPRATLFVLQLPCASPRDEI